MRLLWSQTIPPPLRGLSLARECETILTWDGQDSLFLFNHAGRIQAQRPSPAPILAACCAEDGSAYAVACGGTGVSPVGAPVVCWLAPDLGPCWQRPLRQRATALALEPLGQRLAVADAGGTVTVMDARGRTLWQATTLRPLHHLAFVPEKPLLVGAADFGLVLCFGASGECLWRDGLVAHVGSLAVSGDGSSVLLACFSDGLARYSTVGPEHQRIPLESACPLAALSYDGDCLLTADRRNRLCLRDSKGGLRDQINLDAPAVAAALGAMGDYTVVGLASGALLRFDERAGSVD
ncbi:MAG TPA: PQQ-binding-like beta-propeller repeat protein [Gemmataceae bacterium]|nr:PQQ-binding-like beta-propeller repeat protein [Gemmataceae bacterium]